MPRNSVVRIPDAGGDCFTALDVDGFLISSIAHASPEYQIQAFRGIPNRKAREDDIYLCAYVKTGTHWVWEIINMLLTGKAEITERIKEELMMEVIPEEMQDDAESPRILDTHLPFSMIPRDAIAKKCKFVFLLRNPKDVAVSYYNHLRGMINMYNYSGSWQNYLPLFLEGKVEYGEFCKYHLEWEKSIQENPDLPVHQIFYENLKENPQLEIKRLAKFLGIEHSEEFVKAIAENTNMKNMKEKKDALSPPFISDLWRDGKFEMYRKGEVGDWKNWFTVAQSEMFDAIYKERMKNSKLKFRSKL